MKLNRKKKKKNYVKHPLRNVMPVWAVYIQVSLRVDLFAKITRKLWVFDVICWSTLIS